MVDMAQQGSALPDDPWRRRRPWYDTRELPYLTVDEERSLVWVASRPEPAAVVLSQIHRAYQRRIRWPWIRRILWVAAAAMLPVVFLTQARLDADQPGVLLPVLTIGLFLVCLVMTAIMTVVNDPLPYDRLLESLLKALRAAKATNPRDDKTAALIEAAAAKFYACYRRDTWFRRGRGLYRSDRRRAAQRGAASIASQIRRLDSQTPDFDGIADALMRVILRVSSSAHGWREVEDLALPNEHPWIQPGPLRRIRAAFANETGVTIARAVVVALIAIVAALIVQLINT